MMKFALFLGCNIPARLPHYEDSAKMVLENLSVELTEIKGFNCCGYPLRNLDFRSFVLASARNLALAEKEGLNVMSLCKCCFGSLKKVDHLLKENDGIRQDVNRILGKEGLVYNGNIGVKHLLSVLYHDVGVAAIEKKIEKPFENLRIATHYGCHALRPSQVTQFDNPTAPSLFDELVEATGAQSIDWLTKLECCGAPLLGINDDLSMDLTARKLQNGKKAGADYLCTACPYCQMQFDTVQKKILLKKNIGDALPSILFPQLLGLSMGLDAEALGIQMNHLPFGQFEEFFAVREAAEA